VSRPQDPAWASRVPTGAGTNAAYDFECRRRCGRGMFLRLLKFSGHSVGRATFDGTVRPRSNALGRAQAPEEVARWGWCWGWGRCRRRSQALWNIVVARRATRAALSPRLATTVARNRAFRPGLQCLPESLLPGLRRPRPSAVSTRVMSQPRRRHACVENEARASAAGTAQGIAKSHNQHAEKQHEPRRASVAEEDAARDEKTHER
jgi:hypothetical protein